MPENTISRGNDEPSVIGRVELPATLVAPGRDESGIPSDELGRQA